MYSINIFARNAVDKIRCGRGSGILISLHELGKDDIWILLNAFFYTRFVEANKTVNHF